MLTATGNSEGLADFEVSWRWESGDLRPGFTAVLRVKDEARNLPFVLPPLLRTLANVIVVDNGSTDGTPEIAARVAEEMGAADRLDVLSYPFQVSRCGPEHLQTPADSVHSLTYFYNWAFSHVGTTYSLKWDGDMLLTEEGEQAFTDLAWQLEGEDVVLRVPRYGLYVVSDEVALVDTELQNREPWGWPNREGFRFGKGFEWEIQLFPQAGIRWMNLPDGICFEIKWLDLDEFSHWSHREFGETVRTARKQRELAVFEDLTVGQEVPGLISIDRGDRPHVIDTAQRISVPQWRSMVDVATTE